MLHFMQLAHPRHVDIYVQNSKHKSQNTEVTSFEHRTQNTNHLYTKHNVTYRLPYFCHYYAVMRLKSTDEMIVNIDPGHTAPVFELFSKIYLSLALREIISQTDQ